MVVDHSARADRGCCDLVFYERQKQNGGLNGRLISVRFRFQFASGESAMFAELKQYPGAWALLAGTGLAVAQEALALAVVLAIGAILMRKLEQDHH
jgi:hypothetical protein